MSGFTDFFKPELLALVPALIFVGKILKESLELNPTRIPLALGITGVMLSAIWVFATSPLATGREISMAAFMSCIQGFLCAGAAVYSNQLYKQAMKNQAAKTNKQKSQFDGN